MDGSWIEINGEKQIGPGGAWNCRVGFRCKRLGVGIMKLDEENQSDVNENVLEVKNVNLLVSVRHAWILFINLNGHWTIEP